MNRRNRSHILPLLLALAVCASCFVCFLPQACRAQIVILPQNDQFLGRESITRGDLARIMIAYFPRSLLIRLSAGRMIPDYLADDETVWNFLNGSGILPPMSDGLNYPDDRVIRRNMAILLQEIVRKLAIPVERVQAAPVPSDVDSLSYEALPITQVLALGLLEIDPAGFFHPEAPVTGRQAIEAILTLSRYTRGEEHAPGTKTP